MIEGIDVVFIHVKDPVKMSKWYEEKLGLKINYKTPDLDWQEFELDSKHHSTRFALDYGGLNPSKIEQQSIIISFKVDDIFKVVKHLESRGVIFVGENNVSDVGSSLIATFIDPEGNFLQLSQRK